MMFKLDDTFLTDALKTAAQKLVPDARRALDAIMQKKCVGADQAGWFDWPQQHGTQAVQTIESAAASLDAPYDCVVVLGIGGSYLGARAVFDALAHAFPFSNAARSKHKPLLFAGNTLSERAILDLLDVLEQRQPVINVVSKSGSTLETAVALRIFEEYLIRRYGRDGAKERLLVTTGFNNGALHKFALARGYRLFEIPSDVGGRYSVFTPVGLLPLHLAGIDITSLTAGASVAFAELTRIPAKATHPALWHAAIRRAVWDEGRRIDVLAYQEPSLGCLAEWWKQLFAESEGKADKGLFPVGTLYSTDLHSIGQYMQDGFPSMMETFIEFDGAQPQSVERRIRVPAQEGATDGFQGFVGRHVDALNQAASQAAQRAHADRGVPTIRLQVGILDAYSLGYVMAYFQTVCAVSALLLDVNPFNQPGVEAYKRHMGLILNRQ